MRAPFGDEANPAGRIPECNQILGQDPDTDRIAIRLRDFPGQ